MDCLPEEKERYQFAKNLVHEVSFLRSVWGEQEDFSDEFLATGFMYDVARKMVSVVQQQEQKTDSVIEKELQLAFALIEAGLYQPESSLIPDLIRGTLCDWFGRQEEDPRLFDLLCSRMGPRLKKSLWRTIPSSTISKPQPSKLSTKPIVPLAQPADEEWRLEMLLLSSWSYIFWRSPCKSRYFLSTVCGSVGIYNIDIELNLEERMHYHSKGEEYIEALAKSIQYSPRSFQSRRIQFPKTWIRNPQE